jgi:hypothetical protein
MTDLENQTKKVSRDDPPEHINIHDANTTKYRENYPPLCASIGSFGSTETHRQRGGELSGT